MSKYDIYKSDLENFQNILNKFHSMKIDSNELICLKSFCLFKPYLKNCQTMINPQLNDLHTINYLHHQAQILLNSYITKQYSSEENRFYKFLTLISSFYLISSSSIEEMFFSKNYRR